MSLGRHEENGNSKRTIVVQKKGPGHVCFVPDSLVALPDQFSLHLSLIFEQWLDDNPDIRVRHTLPIVNDGQTVVLHVWFDKFQTQPGP